MPIPRRGRPGWIWAGRIAAAVIVTGLVIYLVRAGLDTADKLGSSISVVVAVAALLTPYLLPTRSQSDISHQSPRQDPQVSAPTLGSETDLRRATSRQIVPDGGTGTETKHRQRRWRRGSVRQVPCGRPRRAGGSGRRSGTANEHLRWRASCSCTRRPAGPDMSPARLLVIERTDMNPRMACWSGAT